MGGPTDDAFEPDTANPICTFEIKGSSGQVAEYSYVINESGPTAYLGEYVPHVNPDAFWGCDLYLLFSNCSSDLTICDLWFFYDPLEEPGTLARMDSMPKSVGKMFGGVHAIMGWSNETYASYNRDRFGAFLSNWWQDTTHHTSTSFLSIGQDRNWDWALGDWRPFVAPAIAVAVGPSNDRYKYLFEKWHRLDDTRAPRDSAMIAWCIPYFDDPDYGYYWVE